MKKIGSHCSGYQDCDEKHRTKFTAKEKGYPNRDAFRLSRLATNVLALVCACAGVYYALTGCLCRVRIIERLAAVAMTLAGGLALSAASFWIYRFDMRPYDDDLTDDQMVCDVGCQCDVASFCYGVRHAIAAMRVYGVLQAERSPSAQARIRGRLARDDPRVRDVLPRKWRRRADEARGRAAGCGFGRGIGYSCRVHACDDAEALATTRRPRRHASVLRIADR